MFCFAGLSLRWDFLNCFHAVKEGYIVELRNTRENDSPVKSLKVGLVLFTVSNI